MREGCARRRRRPASPASLAMTDRDRAPDERERISPRDRLDVDRDRAPEDVGAVVQSNAGRETRDGVRAVLQAPRDCERERVGDVLEVATNAVTGDI